jgi:ketosteroid isomerase-like protein
MSNGMSSNGMSSIGLSRGEVMAWVAMYEQAWRSPGVEALTDLFAPDATYSTRPYASPIQGLDAIAPFWDEARDGPDGIFAMTAEPVAVEGNTAVVRVHVRCGDPVEQEWSDLWVIRFDDDRRAVAFEEWPFAPPAEN